MPPRSRKSITLDIKLDVIKRKEKGQKNCDIVRVLGLPESTVRTIWSKRADILACAKAYGSSDFDSWKTSDQIQLVKTERYLALWVDRREREGADLDKKAIIDKAKLFYRAVCKRDGVSPAGFKASSGWLYRFLGRKKIRRMKNTGESRSADEVAANNFPTVFRGLVEDGGYHPDAIYNMDEAGLQYKLMPKSTFVSQKSKQARGRKVDKSRVTVLFCVNQSGSHKMKPLVIHTAQHPRCYRHLKEMKNAPVYWRSSKKAWVNSKIIKDWLLNCFVPDARWKCRQDKREFKVMLLMDNCPAHPQYLLDAHNCVQVVFLPPKTTSLIQPLDQEIIATVKSRFQAQVFRDMRRSTDSNVEVRQILYNEDGDIDEEEELPDVAEDPDFPSETPELMSVHQFWKNFTVKDAVDNLMLAWESISIPTVRHGWRNLLGKEASGPSGGPSGSESGQAVGFHPAAEALADALVAARSVPGFCDLTEEELLEVQAAGQEITAEELMDSAALEDRLQEEGAPQEGEVREVAQDVVEQPKEMSNAKIGRILAAVD